MPNVLNKPVKDNWFQYPNDLEKMVELVEANAHKDVWYSPILFKSDSRTKENAYTTQVLAADADVCDPDNFRIRPNLVVETSQGRFHVYWLLNDDVDPHWAAKVNRRIAQVHKDEGCDTAFVNAAKLLRVPGTSNGKHLGEVVIVADYDETYMDPSVLDNAYPESEIPDMVEATLAEMPAGLWDTVQNASLSDIISGMPNNTEIRGLMYNAYNEDRRSEVLFKLCCVLYEEGMDDETVAVLAWNSKSNKFRDEDPRGLKGLWDTAIAKAKAAVQAGLQDQQYENDEEEGGTSKKTYVFKEEPAEFLTLDELELIAYKPTFIDEWTAWAKTKSDAPYEYHQAAAILLLSTVYSQYGYVLPSFGKLKLNVWIGVFGRSTKDRKTTAKSYMERMLTALSNEEYSYILPSDSTPGGLELALQDRPNKSSIISRDEAQGFFEEMLHQSYMSGGISYYTSLYDGWSMGRARASGDKKITPRVPISFVFFLSGILDDSAEALTIKNFKQGFLTRFLYVVAERPEGYVEPDIVFIEEDKREEDDMVFQGLHKQLEVGRNHWAMVTPEGELSKVSITPEAVERFSKFRKDVAAKVQDTKYVEVIDSTSDRMTLSTLKLAALLAMHERKQRIELEHLLQAIAFSGKWFDNAVRVASMISESEWLREVNKLEKYIETAGGKVAYAKVYNNFPDMKQRDFEEMVASLESRGVIHRIQVGKRWFLEVNGGE